MSASMPPAYDVYLLAVRRHIFACVVIVAISIVIAVLAAALITPEYRANAIVSLENARLQSMPNQLSLAPAAVDLFAVKAAAETLSSPEVADRTLDALNLWNDPELTQISFLGRAISTVVQTTTDLLRHVPGLEAALNLNSLIGPTGYRDQIRERFMRRISVTQTPQSLLLSIGYMSSDPKKAAHVANSLAGTYLDMGRSIKVKQVQFALGVLELISDRFHDQMIAAQDKLKAYRDKLGIVELGNATQMTAVTQRTVELESRYLAARADRTEREKSLEELRARVKSYSAGSSIGGFASPSIQQLELQRVALLQRRAEIVASYGPDYPLAHRISDLINNIDRSIRSALDTFVGTSGDNLRVAQAKEDALAAELKASRTQSQQQSMVNTHLVDLEAQAAAAKNLFEASRVNIGRATEAISLQLPDARVVAQATIPLRPSSPRLLLFVALGAAIGGVCSILYAYAREASARKLFGITSLERISDTRVLALLPSIDRNSERSSAFRAAVDAVRLQLTSSTAGSGHMAGLVLLVTSSVAEEGKTAVSLALAEASAKSGERVLLIEGDIRKPSRYSSLPGQGLTAILGGRADLGTTKLAEQAPGLFVLPAGPAWTRAIGRAEYERLQVLINQAKMSFDCVVIDSPPVLSTPDARIFSKLSDRVLFLVRWATTSPSTAARGLYEVSQHHPTAPAICITDISLREIKRLSHVDPYSYGTYGYAHMLPGAA